MTALDRRVLLKCLALLPAASAVPLLGACSGKALPEGAPFSLWRAVRDALRESPDHLESRASEVARSGNIESIYEFVRDDIALRPWASNTHYLRVRDAGHAGVRGVLRSGIATEREKAELLHKLLSEAGFESEIVDGDSDFEALGGKSRYFNAQTAEFAPDHTLAPLDDWLEQLDIDPEAISRVATLDPTPLNDTAGRLLDALPADARTATDSWARLNHWTSLVRVRRDGEWLYANPNLPDASLGEHYCKRPPRPSAVQTPVPTPTLKLSLAITRRRAPNRLDPILEGQWPIGDLIGRRVQTRFLPVQSARESLSLPFGQLREFLPTFVVAGSDINESDVDRLGFTGDVLTLEGDRIASDNGDVTVNGEALKLGNSDPALAESVSQVEMIANASEFPRLRVEARLQDRNGEPVNGLPLSTLRLHHGDKPATARLVRNTPEAPRIAFALDLSTSLQESYRGTGLAPVVQRICERVAAAMPEARFRAGAFTGGPAGSGVAWFSDWLAEADATAESVRRSAATAPQASSYFSSLADAVNSDASLVVLITDADGSSSDSPDTAARISEGCPAVVLGVPGPLTRDEHFARLGELSGGHLYVVDELERAIDTLAQLAVYQRDYPYLIEMVADGIDDGDPVVRLTVPTADVSNTAEYDRPAEPVSPARAICGLYLTIELGQRRVTRRIAGYPQISSALRPIADSDIDEVRLALLGKHELSVEAAAPTAAAALEDVVSSYLSCEGLVDAAKSHDEDTILDASSDGFDQLPPRWLALNTPLAGARSANHLSFQDGYRLILFRDVPDVAGHYQRSVDILPFANWRTIAEADEFEKNLRTTLQLSMLEAENFKDSAASRLGDSSYTLGKSFQFSRWASSHADEELNRLWRTAVADRGSPRLQHQLLLPHDPSRLAYWEVDTSTGAVLAMLPDASGGASAADINRKFELLMQVINAYTEVMDALIATPPVFKVWVELEKAKLEHLRRASIAIVLMDGTYTSGYGDLLAEQLEGWITDQVQGTLDDALGDALSGYSEVQEAIGWHDRAQQLWNAASSGD